MHSYMTLSNILINAYEDVYPPFNYRNLLASYKACLHFSLLYKSQHCTVWLFNFCGGQIFMDFSRFLIHDNL